LKKYDIVLGNPPFNKGLWVDFLEKAMEHSNGIVAMIHPDGARKYSSRASKIAGLLLDNGLQTYETCTEHFPSINSGDIVYSICDKTKDSRPEV